YDKRKQKIARAMAKILNTSGLSWGILGTGEHCSGDPARRLGEENLFQSAAKVNLETLRSIRFEKLVANCPHCFNTLRNEYPALGNLAEDRSVEVIHHSIFIKSLLAEGRLSVAKDFDRDLTYHDPCYLGRYNEHYEEPRDVLVQLGSKPIREMRDNRQTGLCCGAGGGHYWFDMKVGERVNSLRVDQAAETGAPVIATGCPFCMQMLEDGVKLTGREETLAVKDLAELVADALIE
ncbi:MAG: (Fe-S)-binding protein, partial [Bdellovibrionales bacterium]|nr:(Fe-S)-binding protein [Bdellovibrionales bacterium]